MPRMPLEVNPNDGTSATFYVEQFQQTTQLHTYLRINHDQIICQT